MLKIFKLSEFFKKINAGEIKVNESSLKRIYRNELVMNSEALILINRAESSELNMFQLFQDNELFNAIVDSLRNRDKFSEKPKYDNIRYKLNLFSNYSAEEIQFSGNRIRVMVAFTDEWCEVIFDPGIRKLIESFITRVDQ